ncbi:aldo/keto reductase [Dictyobacter arantiisoli]|uniref:Oxidoreductase n=1 Tax=Dictyobacter arantiisoli TaxID=2014874 RepID=A0A5A5TEF5_9CHLR|nr:aldo/keto reductase [Dictyobacter arantiisoli]GCF09940.1 oxidoreductase [Dictyobacter arantiisoli]
MTNSDVESSFPLRTLGRTGLQVSALCVGCAPLGDMPETFAYSVGEEQALETVRAIFRSPITFVDTAASYGDGESERRIGIVLKELGGVPGGYVLATKADRDLHTSDFSGAQMRRSVERSLKLLGLDVLPLVYLHDPEHITFEAAMAPGGPVEVLQSLKEEGLIKHLGVAGGPIDLMSRFVETNIFEAAISHNRYTLLDTEADAFWDLCRQHGVGTVNAAPYGSGILAKGPKNYPRYQYEQASEAYLARAFKFEEACERYGVPLAAVALQFSLRDPRIDSTVIGMSRAERVNETVRLSQVSIPSELWNEIEAIRQA